MSEQKQAARTGQEEDVYRFGWRYVERADEKGQVKTIQVPLTEEDVLHPQEDDFIVQNDLHHQDCKYLTAVLDEAINGREGYKVFHDHRIDWQVEGIEPHGPDFAVFADFPPTWKAWENGTFRVKENGARTLLVIEVASPTTRKGDLGAKMDEYHQAGIPFYAIVDYPPDSQDRQIVLLGYRWAATSYVPVPLHEDGRLWLEPVRLWLAGEGDHVVCFDEQGQKLLGPKESRKELAARLEEQMGLTEDAIEGRAEERKARLEAEKAQKEAEEKADEADKARKEAQEKAAEADKQKADTLALMAQMQAELRRLRGEPPA